MAVRYQSQIDYGQVGRSIEQDLQRAQQFAIAGVETFVQNRLEQQRFANTVLENIDSLKDEGDLAHQQAIGAKVDELYNKAKDSIYKYRTTKKGKVKFSGYDFDPEVMREIKNEARNIKNAALRSEQARVAYEQGIRQIASDNTINQKEAIAALDAEFKNSDIIFKGDSTKPDSVALRFNNIIESNVNPELALGAAASQFATKRTSDVGISTADGRSEVIKYNIDYFTPEYDKQGKVFNFTENEDALRRTAQQMRSSRPALMKLTEDEVVDYLRQQFNPISQLRITEPKREVVKPTEAQLKRAEEGYTYKQRKTVLDNIGKRIDTEKPITNDDISRIQEYVGEESLQDVDILSVDDVKKSFESAESIVVSNIEEIAQLKPTTKKLFGTSKGKDQELNTLLREYESGEISFDNLAGEVKDIMRDIVRDPKEEDEKVIELLDEITQVSDEAAPLLEYKDKDYGFVIKDRRGKGAERIRFVDDSRSWKTFSSTLLDVPGRMLSPVEEEEVEAPIVTNERPTIAGF